MQNLTGCAVVFLLSAGAANAAPAAPAAAPEMTTQATQGRGGVPAAKGRLKFKSSRPVCGCAEGLSERDIEQAITKSKPDKLARPNLDAGGSQASGQEETLNLGVTK